MHDLLTKAVEAGARAASDRREDFTTSGYLGAEDTRLWDRDKHVFTGSEADCDAWIESRCVEAALRAALPGILEAVVGVAETKFSHPSYPTGEVVGPCVCGSWPGGECLQCPKVPIGASQVAAAQRALVAQILEGK